MQPALSVVMPTRNQARFIAESVRSVLAPAALPPPGLELVVMDGASTDGTPDLLAQLAGEFPGRLRWHSAPDSGPAQAVNRAVALARAPLLGWLNSDDLYLPGAAARALDHLLTHPAQVMVYGQARHVDQDGQDLGAYPTRGPDTPLAAWADGCHLCQPTAFFRREAFEALGGLDETLHASFDYELWLRLFRAHPGRIGFIDQVQALSRLHAEGITLRLRERVAREGVRVVHRHLGPAPLHWLLTLLGELCERHLSDPAAPATPGPAAQVRALAAELSGCLAPGAAQALEEALAEDRRLACQSPHTAVDVDASGRAPARLALRARQPTAGGRIVSGLWLRGVHRRPGPLHLRWQDARGQPHHFELDGPGAFEVHVDVPDHRPGAGVAWTVVQGGPPPPAGQPAYWLVDAQPCWAPCSVAPALCPV
ncbi:glycosyltransferase family 2 protein [Ideonella livida]|uniref:Glycosyltransferase n=1 Tax=Ideonella livida TaxID=2707176 RepID=A0A7C9TM14_9BURK|nr:glycosyltransferase family 2 protein [Ideonella livida]NDY93940.1 glycosyltransferase [Ideonella livida]